MAQISIDNANRAGVLANMTVAEFNHAYKSSDEGECFVVKVMNHKTLDSKIPANIVLSKKLHRWMNIYLTECRQCVCKDPKYYVQFFLSWNGKHLESNQIAKALTSVFKKANMEVQIRSNDFRKGAVTEYMRTTKTTATATVECVREKCAGIEGLEEMDATEVLQKIRSQWHFPKKQSQPGTSTVEANLLTETETVTQRVNHLFQVHTSSASVI